jgi:aspartyl-tRNA(Asn)/glutamyl-tRNA(Gln) amidotransferase subunit A
VVGFKPSYGRVSLEGALPLSRSTDHGGPLAKTVRDAHFLTEILAGESIP